MKEIELMKILNSEEKCQLNAVKRTITKEENNASDIRTLMKNDDKNKTRNRIRKWDEINQNLMFPRRI